MNCVSNQRKKEEDKKVKEEILDSVLVVDGEKCVGCEICVLQCSLGKTGMFNPAMSRVAIIRWEEKGLYFPLMCQHCGDPPCIPACPVDAISKDKESGIVRIDGDTCTGCELCREACPYGAPSFDPVSGKVVMCDLCEGDPMCAEVCPTGAVLTVKADKNGLAKQRQGRERLTTTLESLVFAETSGKGVSK